MEDIETDSEGYGYGEEGRLRQFRSDLLSKKHTMEERNDSGIESLGYCSAELNSLSINAEDEKIKTESCVNQNASSHIVSLQSSLSKLNISSSDCKEPDPDHFDSGLDNIEFPDVAESEPDYCVPPHFSPEQIMVVFSEDEDGDNHLHMSIIHGLHKLTMQIIELVPDCEWLNHTNYLQQTPLHIAVLTNQASVVRRLVCAGASVDLRDQNGNTPLHNACRLGYEDVVSMLLRPVEAKETLQNKYNIPCQRLPQDLEYRNYDGLTCLHLAAVGGHINIMQLLLNAGANVNAAEGKSGRTVLHFAVEWGNMAMVQFLLSQEFIDLNARTYAGLSPMLLAQGRQNLEAVDELLNSGAFFEEWLSSEDSDDDISDEELSEESVSDRPVSAQRFHHYS